MKNITNKSIEADVRVNDEMYYKYWEAFWEPQEGQPAHFDNQTKLIRCTMEDVRYALRQLYISLSYLKELDVKED